MSAAILIANLEREARRYQRLAALSYIYAECWRMFYEMTGRPHDLNRWRDATYRSAHYAEQARLILGVDEMSEPEKVTPLDWEEMFGTSDIPVDAINFVFNEAPDDMPIADVRAKLRTMGDAHKARMARVEHIATVLVDHFAPESAHYDREQFRAIAMEILNRLDKP